MDRACPLRHFVGGAVVPDWFGARSAWCSGGGSCAAAFWLVAAGVAACDDLFDLRLPRVLIGLLCGAALSLSGGVMQGVFRNPLADPYVLGTVSGATFGAALTILFHLDGSLWALPLGRFWGAFVDGGHAGCVGTADAALLRSRGADPRRSRAGVALVGADGNCAVRKPGRPSAEPGLLAVRESVDGAVAAAWAVCAVGDSDDGSALRQARVLDLLSLGDAMALHLGIEVTSHKRKLMLLSSLLTALSVAACGTIGFVGLVVPTSCGGSSVRAIGRCCYRRSCLAGRFCRCVTPLRARGFAPVEIPVGIITALVGVPFFCRFCSVGHAWGRCRDQRPRLRFSYGDRRVFSDLCLSVQAGSLWR